MIEFFATVAAWMDDPVRREVTGPITYYLVICIPGAVMARRLFKLSWRIWLIPVAAPPPLVIMGWLAPKPVTQAVAGTLLAAYFAAAIVWFGFMLPRRRARARAAAPAAPAAPPAEVDDWTDWAAPTGCACATRAAAAAPALPRGA